MIMFLDLDEVLDSVSVLAKSEKCVEKYTEYNKQLLRI